MEAMVVAAGVVLLSGLTLVAVVMLQRSLDRPGGREGLGSAGDGFDLVNEIFNPAQARATRELKRYEEKREVAPSPDDDDDRPLRLVRNPDGTLRAVRLRRPAG